MNQETYNEIMELKSKYEIKANRLREERDNYLHHIVKLNEAIHNLTTDHYSLMKKKCDHYYPSMLSALDRSHDYSICPICDDIV